MRPQVNDLSVFCLSWRLGQLLAVKVGLFVLFLALAAWLGIVPRVWSQCSWEQLYTFTGYAAEDLFGHSVSGAGDVNNDGYDDLIVGALYNDAGGTDAGRAYVYSGFDWALLWTFTGAAPDDRFGISVSGAGDVNNDGYDDLIVGADYNDAGGTDAGRAYVYSGQTGALLWTFTGAAADDRLGFSVSGAGDVNIDGYDDVIVGAYLNDTGGADIGQAYVYSGLTGLPLWTFTGESAGDVFGRAVSEAGDVNNDGYDDVIVGAQGHDALGSNTGRAYVYSGQTGTLLWTFTGEAAEDRFGHSVSGAGDVDNDGYDDLVMGAYLNDGGGSNAGRAYVYSGQTGALLWTFTGEAAEDRLGISVSGAMDVNSDGYDDLIAGAYGNDAGGNSAGRAYVYSGFNGLLLSTFTGKAAEDAFGVSVSSAGDVNNDGVADLIVGAEENDIGGSNAGQAYVYSGLTGVLCFTGEAAGDRLGWSVADAGDVNNDDYDDLVVGAPYADEEGNTDCGKMYVYSGTTGSLLHQAYLTQNESYSGASVSGAGDVNNDGYDDVIAGAPGYDGIGTDAGGAFVMSGQTWSVLHFFDGKAEHDGFGFSVSGAGEYDIADGYDDLVVGAPYRDAAGENHGASYVFSGQNGAGFPPIIGSEAYDDHGYSVSGLGDVNNDVLDDYIVGSPGNDAGGNNAGRADVRSGNSGLYCVLLGEAAGDQFGYSVSGAGDVDNDGYADWIVGAPGNDMAGDGAGRAYVFSGQTKALLWTFPGEASYDAFGSSVSGAGDVNNDGYDDLMVGAPGNDAEANDAGRAYVFSGRNGSLLCVFTGESSGDYFGWSVSGAGDVDNDGYDEVIVGAPLNNAGGTDAGRAYVLSCEAYANYLCGDVTGDEIINVGDIVYLVSYLYRSGPAPVPDCVGDINCDDIVNVGDVVFLVSYLYRAGPSPRPYCCLELIRGYCGFSGR